MNPYVMGLRKIIPTELVGYVIPEKNPEFTKGFFAVLRCLFLLKLGRDFFLKLYQEAQVEVYTPAS